MEWLQALILGIVQGLTEFLPISSSGHLELGKEILNAELTNSLAFIVAVHGATVLSTIVVFRKDILQLLAGFFKFRWNEETRYITYILLSMVPVVIIGLFFKERIEHFFTGNLLLVGSMLLITALLLAFSYINKNNTQNISYFKAFIIGIAQAFAVLPGISRSGATIATGLMLGVKRAETARFSFLMVSLPVIGANFLEALDGNFSAGNANMLPIAIGFIAAFISGFLACKWMVGIVKRGGLIYFAIYCLLVGGIAIGVSTM